MFNCEHPIFITLKPLSCRYHHDVQVVVDRVHTRASVKESKGYPPSQKNFGSRLLPLKKGTLWQNIPPLLEKFEPKIQRVPPPGLKILENF